MDRLQGKTALVTGGGQGIGRAICQKFAAHGATVFVADLFPDRAQSTAELIKAAGGKAFCGHVDVAQESSVKAMVAQAVERMGSIEILVNNAGIELFKTITDMTVEEWDRVMAVNVRGVFLCSKHVIPHMKKAGKGNIINMGSVGGYVGAPFQTVYCASKGAVHQFTKCLALELTAANIKVNAISPGGVNTAMLDYLKQEFSKQGVDLTAALKLQQFGGEVQPDDVADMAVFLAGDESRSVHGAALLVDGGFSAS
ncbi:MAG: SDR family NAD(P)-dependent oxidoreductase [Terriglobales bacterium]